MWIACWLALLSQPAYAAVQSAEPPGNPFPQVASSYLVEVNGERVWEKQPARHLPPASLTKLMTALLVIEKGQLESTVSVSNAAAHETGSRLGLVQGEKLRAADLLAAALIVSANDACHALADFVAGDESRFVQQMNSRAAQLGMRDSRFTNACGHDASGHYSSARDLALLSRELLKHPEALDLSAQPRARITTLDGARSYEFETRNALIGRYLCARGLKTGYTPNAGKCLVAYAERGNDRVLLVILHGQDRWWDAADILDLAFSHARR